MNVCYISAVVNDSVFSLAVLKYVICLCKGCDGCCVFCLYCDAWSCMCSCMGGMSVSSCRCCMFVSCVHHVAFINAAFCMTCSLLMLEDARGDHTEEAYSRAGLMTAFPDSTTTSDLRRIPLAEHRQGCTLFTTSIQPRTIVVYWCAISWC